MSYTDKSKNDAFSSYGYNSLDNNHPPSEPHHSMEDDNIIGFITTGAGSSRYSNRQDGVAPPAYTDDDIPQDFKIGVTVAQSDLSIRMAFIRNVYTILSLQLGLTMLVGGLLKFNDTVQQLAFENVWLFYTSLIGTFVSLLLLVWKRKNHPLNFYLLFAFTFFEGYTLGMTVSMVDSITVLQAIIITFTIFVGLTLFTLQSKWDFSGLAPFLFGSLMILITIGLIQIFIPFGEIADLVMAITIAVVFSGFILFDTFQIMNRLSPEEYIMASADLYLDVLNLFVAILRILNHGNRD